MEQVLFTNPTIRQILDKYRTLWSLNYLVRLANWYLNTYMPEDGAIARGEALAKISSLSQKLFLDKEFRELIKQVQNEAGSMNDCEKAVVRILTKDLEQYEKLPAEFLEEFSRITN